MARVLGESDLNEEARAPMINALLATAQAWAIENRLPEPNSIEDVLRPPLAFMWKDGLESLRRFVEDASASWRLPLTDFDAAL